MLRHGLELQKRGCCNCKSCFWVLPTSKQLFCSWECMTYKTEGEFRKFNFANAKRGKRRKPDVNETSSESISGWAEESDAIFDSHIDWSDLR